MSDFHKQYEATVKKLQQTEDGVRVTLDIKVAKEEAIELERRGKHALFRSILKEKPTIMAADFVEEII